MATFDVKAESFSVTFTAEEVARWKKLGQSDPVAWLADQSRTHVADLEKSSREREVREVGLEADLAVPPGLTSDEKTALETAWADIKASRKAALEA